MIICSWKAVFKTFQFFSVPFSQFIILIYDLINYFRIRYSSFFSGFCFCKIYFIILSLCPSLSLVSNLESSAYFWYSTLLQAESVSRRCSLTKCVRLEITKNSQESTCARVCLSIKFKAEAGTESLAQVFSCEFCKIFKNTYYTEYLWKTASI